MSVTPVPSIQKISRAIAPPMLTWEKPPKDYKFEEKPVDNSGQPLLVAALRESLEIAGFIQSQMLIVSNFGLCAAINGELVIKAPDWLYVPAVNWDAIGNLLPWAVEQIAQERQQANRLAEYLRSQGIDPDQV
jgi:hypothetical protein